jgi:hypothetical protein
MEANELEQSDETQGLDVISRIAEQRAEQRRREAQPILERKLPEWILEITQTQVVYTFSPRMLPLKHASFPSFMQMLKDKYSWLCCIITPYFAQKPYYAGFSQ